MKARISYRKARKFASGTSPFALCVCLGSKQKVVIRLGISPSPARWIGMAL